MTTPPHSSPPHSSDQFTPDEATRPVSSSRPEVETQPPQAFRSTEDPQTALHQAMMIEHPHLHAFLPLFDPIFRPKRLVLITLASHYPNAVYVQTYFENQGIDVEIWMIQAQRGVEAIFRLFQDYLKREKHTFLSLSLNFKSTN